MIAHCRPTCASCEAVERLGRVALVLEELGDASAADAVYRLAELTGRRDAPGGRLVAALLTDTRAGVEP